VLKLSRPALETRRVGARVWVLIGGLVFGRRGREGIIGQVEREDERRGRAVGRTIKVQRGRGRG
jgi:hypothetical protein